MAPAYAAWTQLHGEGRQGPDLVAAVRSLVTRTLCSPGVVPHVKLDGRVCW